MGSPWTSRRAGALLATLALLAMPLRAVVACTMPAAIASVESETVNTPAEHADHGEHGALPGSLPDGGRHTACPDIAGCLAVAVLERPPVVGNTDAPPAAPRALVPLHVESPALALEPPPPKS